MILRSPQLPLLFKCVRLRFYISQSFLIIKGYPTFYFLHADSCFTNFKIIEDDRINPINTEVTKKPTKVTFPTRYQVSSQLARMQALAEVCWYRNETLYKVTEFYVSKTGAVKANHKDLLLAFGQNNCLLSITSSLL